ncbi:MAG: protein sip-5 [Luteimonas sp.]|nr:protein sip-5 [Luteimonas sp.]
MNFEALRRRVERTERLVEGRIAQVSEQRTRLGRQWRQAWTPGRILAVGLLGGALVAHARPLRTLRAVSATRWVQLATSLSGLFAALQATWAAPAAESAAKGGEGATGAANAPDEGAAAPDGAAQAQAVTGGDAVAPVPVSDRRRRPDPQWDTAPSPAEAATEVSER